MLPLVAVVHTMTSVATGGFATSDASFGAYADEPQLLLMSSMFMLAGALDAVRFYTKRKTITQRWPSAGIREGAQFSFLS